MIFVTYSIHSAPSLPDINALVVRYPSMCAQSVLTRQGIANTRTWVVSLR